MRQASDLVRKTPLDFVEDWAAFDIADARLEIRLPPLPRGLTETVTGLLIHTLCDLVMTTKPDTSARWYGVLGAFGALEGILPVLPAEGSQVLEDDGS